MRRLALLALAAGPLFPVLAPAPAQAQATRTWVSGVGDDANSCSRTAPCKTFTGAILKTASGGEVNCLDGGGYLTVNITKAINISCEAGTASILVAGTSGITINASSTDEIRLKGLDINGLNSAGQTSLYGINFISGKSVTIEDCQIYGFTLGVKFAPTAPAFLTIMRSTLSFNGLPNTGGAMQIAPGAGGYGIVALMDVRIVRNYIGIGGGGGGGTVLADIIDSKISNNSGDAISVSAGATVRIVSSMITGNGGAATSGNVLSAGNNLIAGNSPDTIPSPVALH